MIDAWVHSINSLASVATRFPHSAYAGLVGCLMAEWQYICCIVPDIGPLLAPIEDALHTKFLPAILGPDIAINNDLRNLLALGIKSSGITIQNPILIVDSLFRTPKMLPHTFPGLSSATNPSAPTINDLPSAPQALPAGRSIAMAKMPSSRHSSRACRQKNALNKLVPPVPGSPQYLTAFPVPSSPRPSGSTTLPSGTALGCHTSHPAATAAARAS
ncbi:LOW QUALITY PROTEIN: hypothetical protein ACHAW6_001614 [Cyclotella cf. meneghiniana]